MFWNKIQKKQKNSKKIKKALDKFLNRVYIMHIVSDDDVAG